MNDVSKIKKALRELGVTPDLKCYHYVEKGVMLVKSDFERGKTARSFMKLYRDISVAFDTKVSCVERCMRHAVEVSEINNTKLFDHLFGNLKSVTVSNFICIIAEHISEPNEF